mmetsp:Transcript_52967/g.128487  ORF Transcript_52967/g.128487 Transcript_52967/m.128487 type:complete len:277 (-) Transcript_52967:2061-2891(-)
MAPAIATGRLRKELINLQRAPPPGCMAEVDESNILKWYYAIRGPSDTPYEDGIYIGKLIFPSQYPMKPPSITMMTPSGRFQVNTKICMSMSDFHPESWNPMWSVATIIQGIQSFMSSDELTTGGMKAPEPERKKFAAASIAFNEKMFPQLFGGDVVGAMKEADEKSKEALEKSASEAARSDGSGSGAGGARAAAAARRRRQQQQQQDVEDKNENGDEENEDDDEQVEGSKAELTPEEIEKRRKKNAKKRAKQKAKKKAAAAEEDSASAVTAGGDGE